MLQSQGRTTVHKDEFLYHEAVERLLIISEVVQAVLDHPTINAEPVVREMVVDAVGLLCNAYQIMAQIRIDHFPEAA